MGAALQEKLGYNIQVADNRLIIPSDDPLLRAGPPDVLEMSHVVPIPGSSYADCAEKLASLVPTDLEDALVATKRKLPETIKLRGGLGLIDDLYQSMVELALCNPDQVAHHLEHSLLPLLVENFDVKYCVAVSVRSTVQQTYNSMAKIFSLMEKYTSDEVEELVFQRGAYGGVEMRGGIEILSFLIAVTRLSPISFTLPVSRMNTTWHFYGDGAASFGYEGSQSLFGHFIDAGNPRTDYSSVSVLNGLGEVTENRVFQLLRLAVRGINQLMAHANDPRTFQSETGEINWEKKLKLYAGLNLLFCDLQGVNFSTEIHSKVTFSLGFMDKFANFKKLAGNVEGAEPEVMKSLASIKHAQFLRDTYTQFMGGMFPELFDMFYRPLIKCFRNIHLSLGRQLIPDGSYSERFRLDRLRTLRNMNHGALLRGNNFEDIYSRSKGSLPQDIVTLPFLISIGLMCDPIKVLRFDAR